MEAVVAVSARADPLAEIVQQRYPPAGRRLAVAPQRVKALVLAPLSRSNLFTHSLSVCAVQPIFPAVEETAAQREACSPS